MFFTTDRLAGWLLLDLASYTANKTDELFQRREWGKNFASYALVSTAN